MNAETESFPPLGNDRRGDAFARLLQGWRAGGGPTLVMGVLNVTPDSFSDGGLFADTGGAVAHGRAMIEAGAALIDVGGESTRPQALPVPAEEEIRRVVPVITPLSEAGAVLSVDTIKPEVAEVALRAGAEVVNDVRGLADERMAEIVARHGAGIVIMHNPGILGASSGTEGDPVQACLAFFERALEGADRAGVLRDRIVLDPGYGFGKTLEQNLALIGRLSELSVLGLPILAGASRKSFIGRLLSREVDQRLAGTLAAHVLAALQGAAIVRVHEVAEHVDAMRMVMAVREASAAR